RALLVSAVSMERYDALVLANGNNFYSDCNGIANVNRCKKFQSLSQINGTWPRHMSSLACLSSRHDWTGIYHCWAVLSRSVRFPRIHYRTRPLNGIYKHHTGIIAKHKMVDR